MPVDLGRVFFLPDSPPREPLAAGCFCSAGPGPAFRRWPHFPPVRAAVPFSLFCCDADPPDPDPDDAWRARARAASECEFTGLLTR